jgi:hypothetical protein
MESVEQEKAKESVVSAMQQPVQKQTMAHSLAKLEAHPLPMPKLEAPRYPSSVSRRTSSVVMNHPRKMEVKEAWTQKRPMSANVYKRRVSQMTNASSSVKSSTKK